jgi:hypothetical protein
MRKTSTITTSSAHGLRRGDRIELHDGAIQVVIATTTTTLTVRPASWLERGFWRLQAWLERTFRTIRDRLVARRETRALMRRMKGDL